MGVLLWKAFRCDVALTDSIVRAAETKKCFFYIMGNEMLSAKYSG